MIYLIIGIAVYLLTIVVYFLLERNDQKRERKVVTIGSVVSGLDEFMFIPVFNSAILIVFSVCCFLLEKCQIASPFQWLWNKIKDIKL